MSESMVSKTTAGATATTGKTTTETMVQDRILFVYEITNFGGGERVYLSLSKFMHAQGIPHRIVSYYQGIRLQDYADWPVKVEILSPKRNPLNKAWTLKKYLARQQALGVEKPLLVGLQSVMHAATFGSKDYALLILDTPSLLTTNRVQRSALSRLAAPLRSLLFERLTRRGVHQASPVIITTEIMAREIEGLYGLRPLVSHQGVAGDKADYRHRPLTLGKPLRLLSVCRLEGTKRIDWILRSLAALEAQEPPLHERKDWRLDVVGEGSCEGDLRSLVNSLGLADRVVFHGLVSNERLEEIYNEADLFLMPAVQGYGLPALEALTRKIPIVMHAQSGVSEVLGGTPWVEIITGGEETLTAGVGAMIGRLLGEGLTENTLPEFPTESQWAEEICRLCGWIEGDVERGHSE